jgi:hypothetical protein
MATLSDKAATSPIFLAPSAPTPSKLSPEAASTSLLDGDVAKKAATRAD